MSSFESSFTKSYSERQNVALSGVSKGVPNNTVQANGPKSPQLSLDALKEGQLLQAEVVDRTATEVTIRLLGDSFANASVLKARLDASVPLSIGQTASFEILHADASQLTLHVQEAPPSLMQNALITRALSAAELAHTEHNALLVQALLSQNLPINKESLLSLARQSNAFPDAPLPTLAFLTKEKIPINEGSLSQFMAYRGQNHQLMPQLTNLSELLVAFASNYSTTPSSKNVENAPLSNELPTASRQEQPSLQRSLLENTALPDLTKDIEQSTNEQGKAFSTIGGEQKELFASLERGQENEVLSALEGRQENEVLSALEGRQENEVLSALEGRQENEVLSALEGRQENEVLSALEGKQTREPSATSDSLSELFSHFFEEELEHPQEAATSLRQELLSRWSLSPKDLSHQKKLGDFYSKLKRDLSDLHESLKAIKKEELPSSQERLLLEATKATKQLLDNVDFMLQLNRFFPYAQLPLRLTEKATSGELYVYTKKDRKTNSSEGVSVLLHLDMEALGPTDIYLRLYKNRLDSSFTLSDPGLQKLFSSHLPELKEALEKQGFQVAFKFVSGEKEKDPVRAFLDIHDQTGLTRFGFDCRA